MKILTNIPWVQEEVVQEKIIAEKVLSEQSLIELLYPERSFESTPALVYNKNESGKNDSSTRSTTRYMVDYKWFPEICKELEEHIGDGTVVNQFDLLHYRKGDKFNRHLDESRGYKPLKRRWSTITLLDKSDDLVGGDLIIYRDEYDRVGQILDLKIGETVVFSSQHVWHEVTEVTRGTRLALVAWLVPNA